MFTTILPSRYRIRGLTDLAPDEPGPRLIPAAPAGTDPSTRLGQILRALGRPHLGDVIYHPRILRRLSARWPTFSYLRPRAVGSAMKEAPLRLYDYLDDSAQDSACLDIVLLGDYQEAEEKAMEGVLWDEQEGSAPVLSDSPLAMALMCYFQRGTPWLKDRQNQVLPVVLRSASASYLALASGYFSGDVKALLDKSAQEPGLTLEIWRNETLRALAPEEWFAAALDHHPVHLAVWLLLQGQGEQAWAWLLQSAGSHALSAGVCLGLEPTHERADDWLAVVAGQAEPFYWMGKVWRCGGNDITIHPHLPTALTELRRDLRWNYLWIRDVTPQEALSRLPELWPSPWAVELILDLGLPIGLIFGQVDWGKLDPKKAEDSAVLRWAADNSLTCP